jgi:glutathione S-transferase
VLRGPDLLSAHAAVGQRSHESRPVSAYRHEAIAADRWAGTGSVRLSNDVRSFVGCRGRCEMARGTAQLPGASPRLLRRSPPRSLARRGCWGDQFAVADIVCPGVVGSAASLDLVEPCPALRDYVARGEARPAHAAAVAHAV